MKLKINLKGKAYINSKNQEYFCELIIDPSEGKTLFLYVINDRNNRPSENYDSIYCEMQDGSKWTLLIARQFSISVKNSSFTIVEYDIQWAIKNLYCDRIEDVLVYEASIKLEGLNKWLNKSGFHDHIFGNDFTSSIKFTKPNDILLLDIDEEVEVYANYYFSDKIPVKNKYKLKQNLKLYFKFKGNKIVSIDKSTKFINQFIGLFNVLWLEHPKIDFYEITLKDDNSGKYFQSQVYYTQREAKYKISNDFNRFSIVHYSDIENNICNIFNKWLELVYKIEPVINLVIEYQLKGNKITTNSLLNLSQALETFHRRLRNNKLIDEIEYNNKLTNILDSVNIEYKSWLKERLLFGNEPNLRNRLEDIFCEIPDYLINSIVSDKKTFIRAIVDNRNYFTHFDKRYEKKKMLSLNEITILNEKLHLILTLLILKEIGIDYSNFTLFLRRNSNRLVALRESL